MIIDTKYQTPVQICDYMVSLIPKTSIRVFKPTPGSENLVKILEKQNRFEIHVAEDFFLHDKAQRYDTIILNPPFSEKSVYMKRVPDNIRFADMQVGYQILTECMKISDNVIALMPWVALSDSDVRLRYLKSFGLKSLTALPGKTFQYARKQTVIIELQKGFIGETVFRTLSF